MTRLHVFMHAVLDGEDNAITEAELIVAENPVAVAYEFARWLRTRADEVEQGIAEGALYSYPQPVDKEPAKDQEH